MYFFGEDTIDTWATCIYVCWGVARFCSHRGRHMWKFSVCWWLYRM